MFKAGMDMYDQDLTQAQEKEWIKLNEHLYGYTDEEVGAVARCISDDLFGLTDAKTAGIINNNESLKKVLPAGHADKATIEQFAGELQNCTSDAFATYLSENGYETNIRASTKSKAKAEIIQIGNNSQMKNISQIQVSPGGGRHGAKPYIKISTTDQGVFKIVFGSRTEYRTDGNEKAVLIFVEE